MAANDISAPTAKENKKIISFNVRKAGDQKAWDDCRGDGAVKEEKGK
jgi:hypothetical protein